MCVVISIMISQGPLLWALLSRGPHPPPHPLTPTYPSPPPFSPPPPTSVRKSFHLKKVSLPHPHPTPPPTHHTPCRMSSFLFPSDLPSFFVSNLLLPSLLRLPSCQSSSPLLIFFATFPQLSLFLSSFFVFFPSTSCLRCPLLCYLPYLIPPVLYFSCLVVSSFFFYPGRPMLPPLIHFTILVPVHSSLFSCFLTPSINHFLFA